MQSPFVKLILSLSVLSTVVTFSRCIPDKGNSVSLTQTVEVASETPSPSRTATPKITSEPPVERFYRIISDANYLKNCRNQFPTVTDEQISFRGVFPGKTTSDQMLENLGNPRTHNITIGGYEEWLYYDDNLSSAYSVHTKNSIVDFVTVEVDSELLLPLKDILNKYGCPDLIVATELDPPPFAEVHNYNTTFFIYHRAGIEIRFEGYPVSYSDPASMINLVKPLSLKDYLENKYEQALLVNDFSSPVALEEAVKEN